MTIVTDYKPALSYDNGRPIEWQDQKCHSGTLILQSLLKIANLRVRFVNRKHDAFESRAKGIEFELHHTNESQNIEMNHI